MNKPSLLLSICATCCLLAFWLVPQASACIPEASEKQTGDLDDVLQLLVKSDWTNAAKASQLMADSASAKVCLAICQKELGESSSVTTELPLEKLEFAIVDLVNAYKKRLPLDKRKVFDLKSKFDGDESLEVAAWNFRERAELIKQTLGHTFNGRFVFTREDNAEVERLERERKSLAKKLNEWRASLRSPNAEEKKMLDKQTDLQRASGSWLAFLFDPETGILAERTMVVTIYNGQLLLQAKGHTFMRAATDLKREEIQISGNDTLDHWWGKMLAMPLPFVDASQNDSWYLYAPPEEGSEVEYLLLKTAPAKRKGGVKKYDPRQLELVLIRDAGLRKLSKLTTKLLVEKSATDDALEGKWELVKVDSEPLLGDETVDFEFNHGTVRKLLVNNKKTSEVETDRSLVRQCVTRGIGKVREMEWISGGDVQKGIYSIVKGQLWVCLGKTNAKRPKKFSIDERTQELLVFKRPGATGALATLSELDDSPVVLPVGTILKGKKQMPGSEISMTVEITKRTGLRFSGVSRSELGSASVRGTVKGSVLEFDEFKRLDGELIVPCHYQGKLTDLQIKGSWAAGREKSSFQLSVEK